MAPRLIWLWVLSSNTFMKWSKSCCNTQLAFARSDFQLNLLKMFLAHGPVLNLRKISFAYQDEKTSYSREGFIVTFRNLYCWQ